jgi:predicted Zn-dependent protease
VLLPFSRTHESEADHLGLVFMAMAGYDPHEAIGFWQRMAKAKGGQSPPEFLSTHPSDQTRIDEISRLVPEAMQYYRKGQ